MGFQAKYFGSGFKVPSELVGGVNIYKQTDKMPFKNRYGQPFLFAGMYLKISGCMDHFFDHVFGKNE